MARPPASLWSQAPDRDQGEANVVTRVSQWADNHLRLVQNISTGMAIAGIMLLIRSIRLTSKFTTSSDIPVEFIRKKVKLCGRLQRITECGLEIEHIPITLPFISSWKQITYSPLSWLASDIQGFTCLCLPAPGYEPELPCLAGGYFNVNLNEEILRRGLGKTVLVKGLNYDSKTHWKIHRNLLKAELTALKKGEGIWKEESEKESYFRKLKDSWRERWTKDNDLKPAGADLGSTKDSYDDSRRRASGKGKDCVGNHSFFLKLREFVSRLHFWRKG
ncbi:protein C3orf33 homolog [Mus caroli]|uniref:Protein C3orf33 homolog n=1 Tax=Mus caroli TaxID=10089 RepID=A0A6P5PJE8_MUSCR|nr:protein C3orf33 homolog [Mus caroli]